MVEIVRFSPERHWRQWEQFIVSSYGNPNYVLLSPVFFRWQFLDNPANTTGEHTLWIVVHGDAVIAQLGEVPFAGVSSDGQKFNGSYPVNLIVRPDYRESGLGAILLSRLLRRVTHVLNPGSSESGATLCAGLGMQDLGTLRRYLCVVDTQAARRLALEGRLPRGIASVAAREPALGAGVVSVTELPARAADAFPFPSPAFGAERSLPYLRWRYEKHPSFRYEFLLSQDLRNILVYREEHEAETQTRAIRIVDLLAHGPAQRDLLAAAIDVARMRKAALVDFYCSSTAYQAALTVTNFFDEADHPEAVIASRLQPLDFRKTTIRVLAARVGASLGQQQHTWFITKGDSDQDRPNDRRAGALFERKMDRPG